MSEHKFKVGDRVKHHSEGNGTVVAVNDEIVHVKLDSGTEGGGMYGSWITTEHALTPLISPAVPERYRGELREGMRVKNEVTREMVVFKKGDVWMVRYPEESESKGFELERLKNGQWRLVEWPVEYLTHVISEPKEEPKKTFCNIPIIERDDCPPGVMYLVGADFSVPAMITNSPDKGANRPMLKKVTNLIKGLSQPLRNYVRLGWVEIDEDEYVVTEEGAEALQAHMFGLSGAKDMAEYAAKEVLARTPAQKDEEDEE